MNQHTNTFVQLHENEQKKTYKYYSYIYFLLCYEHNAIK